MRKFSLLFLLIPLFSLSQNRSADIDSVRFYSKELYRLRKQADDSLKASIAYREALAGIERHRRKSNNYAGFVLFSGIVHSNFTTLNQSLVQNGFTPLNSICPQFGVGISSKSDETIFDFYFMVGSGTKESKKGEEKISFSLLNAFQMDIGFDLLKSKTISFYPFVGLSFRETTLNYDKPVQLNTNFTSISNMVINDQSVVLNSGRLGYQAGLGFDVILGENKKHTTNKVLFVKGGTNRPVWKDKYSFHGLNYDPHIKSGDWVISFGIKFGNKN